MRGILSILLLFTGCSGDTSRDTNMSISQANLNKSMNAGSVERDGFNLGYCIEGSGPNTLIVGSALYYSRTFSQNLKNHLRCVFMDHRGFAMGPGQVDNSAFDLNMLVDDMEYMRQHLALGRIIVVGHSGHGYMALEYAKKYPEHVSHVVLIGISPDLSSKSHKSADQYLQDSVCPQRKAYLEQNLQHLAADIQAAPEKRFVSYCLRIGARTWYDFTFDAASLWQGITVNMQMIDYVWGVVFRDIDITQGLESFNKPVFLGLGRYDYSVAPPCSWDPLRPQFKDLTIRVFEQSSHNPQYEEASSFDQELLQWLSSRP